MSCPPHKMNATGDGCANCEMSIEEMRTTQGARLRAEKAATLAEATERAQPRSEAAKRGWITRKRKS